MKKYLCPACHEHTISFWQKHTLGPMRKIQCKNCDALIGVPFFAGTAFVLLAIIGSTLGGVAALLVIQPAANLLLVFAIFVFGSLLPGAFILWLYERLVPLVVKNT